MLRTVILPFVLAGLMLGGALFAWRASQPDVSERLGRHARSLGRQTIEREIARLEAARERAEPGKEGAIEQALAEEQQRLAVASTRSVDEKPREPTLVGAAERCESCHANAATCGLSHPREIAEALRREPRSTVKERFCTTDARIDAIVSLVRRLCAPPGDDARDCEEDGELTPVLDEASQAYCGTTERRRFCSSDEPEALLADAAELLPPPGWARSQPGFGVLLGEKHPVATYGCSSCHDRSTLSTGPHGDEPIVPEEFERVGPTRGVAMRAAFEQFSRFATGELFLAAEPTGGASARKHELLARCSGCHLPQVASLPGAEEVWRGHQLLSDLGCQGCHAGPRDGFVKPGPPLAQLARKLRPEYLLEWLRDPRALRPRTRMPNFWPESVPESVRDREVQVIATWLLLEGGQAAVQHAEAPAGDPSRGAELFDEIGCRGCHELGSAEGNRPLATTAERDFAPNLSDAGDRLRSGWTWLWLKDPQAWWPEARMPNLRLSDRDAADLTAYLMEQRSGTERSAVTLVEADAATAPALMERYGCHGCHDVPGLEQAKPVAAGLASVALAAGQVSPAQWREWTEAKLRNAREPEGQPGDHRMPDYGLSEAELDGLMLALRTLAPPRFSGQYAARLPLESRTLAEGERLANRYGCRNCHRVGGEGGLLLDRYDDEERAPYAPPALDGQASRTHREWLAGFLQKPSTLRPWLQVRMPTFALKPAEIEAILDWFEAREPHRSEAAEDGEPASPETLAEARELVELLQCRRCHPSAGGSLKRVEELGPDLALAPRRLRPDWLRRWLADPQRLQPGTRMPAYFAEQPDGTVATPAPHLLGGSGHRQIEALQQLLVHGIDRGE